MRTVLTAAAVFVLAATLACTGKKDTPGVVGNQYPHEAQDVTGSPYQTYHALQNKQGVNRDTESVRGPSLIPQPTVEASKTGAPDASTK